MIAGKRHTHYWVCADDTDMPGTRGTGWLLQDICGKLEEQGLGTCSPVSRHQLFVHDDVPFTSHNSAMCVEINLAPGRTPEELTGRLITALEYRSQKGSDPGLCIAGTVPADARDRLLAFGREAKTRICTKSDAYGLARKLGIHLSEHGGTGGGVIGALAGVGLRMSGNDGRYRGWYHLGNPGEVFDAGALCRHTFIDRLVLPSGAALDPGEKVAVGSEKTKTVRLGFERVVVAVPNEAAGRTGIPYRTITKQEAKQY